MFFAGAVFAAVALAMVAKDPVVMEVGGEKVPLSEFEYLYNKNNRQQIEKESLEKYVDRFIVYKRKVAAARDAGIDTTQSYKKEYASYLKDLAAPFLVDTTVNEALAREYYQYMSNDVDLSHIVLPKPKTPAEKETYMARLDSIRNCVLAGEDFAALAKKFSADRSAQRTGGRINFAKANRLPYDFVKVVWNLKDDELSKPFDSGYGIHIAKRHGSRPASDKVLAEHILILFPRGQEVTDSIRNDVNAKMDDIYKKVLAGENFEELARKHSQDPGSARDGGKIRWFSTGEMVPEFEKVAFELAKGEVSKPFETSYGVHIVKKLDQKPFESFEESRAQIIEGFARDSRATAAHDAKMNELKAKYKLTQNAGLENYIKAESDAVNANDSLLLVRLKNSQFAVSTYKNGKITITDATKKMRSIKSANAAESVRRAATALENATITDLYLNDLEKTDPEFRNLLKEYRDGMMLFEISDKRVWSAASKDEKGLQDYFTQHRSDYNWTEPRFKGIALSARNDSILNDAKEKIKNLPTNDAIALVHKEYRNKAKIERLLCAKGENPVADKLGFKIGSKKKDTKMPACDLIEGKIIDQPESVDDVKAQVIADYQAYLEEAWLKELAAKYPAKVNEKVLKTVK